MRRNALIASLLLLAASAGATVGNGPSVSLGNAGKTNVWVSSSAATSAVGAAIVLSSRTTTSGKTFYLQHVEVTGIQMGVVLSTQVNMGVITLITPTGVTASSMTLVWQGDQPKPWVIDFAEPVPIGSLVTFAAKAVANTSAAITWVSNVIGYEK